MSDIRLRVTPDELKGKAGEISRQIANAQRYWDSLCETVRASKHYWEGDAGDCGRKFLEDISQDVQTVFARLREHPADLLEMAGIYIDAEEKALEMADVLPDDVIQ